MLKCNREFRSPQRGTFAYNITYAIDYQFTTNGSALNRSVASSKTISAHLLRRLRRARRPGVDFHSKLHR
jgi:hypothetical protein